MGEVRYGENNAMSVVLLMLQSEPDTKIVELRDCFVVVTVVKVVVNSVLNE